MKEALVVAGQRDAAGDRAISLDLVDGQAGQFVLDVQLVGAVREVRNVRIGGFLHRVLGTRSQVILHEVLVGLRRGRIGNGRLGHRNIGGRQQACMLREEVGGHPPDAVDPVQATRFDIDLVVASDNKVTSGVLDQHHFGRFLVAFASFGRLGLILAVVRVEIVVLDLVVRLVMVVTTALRAQRALGHGRVATRIRAGKGLGLRRDRHGIPGSIPVTGAIGGQCPDAFQLGGR